MTFAQLQARLYKSVQRDDLLATNDPDENYGTYINDALLEIQRRRNWSQMKSLPTNVTITSGNASVVLPSTFKTFQNLRPPVHIVLPPDPVLGSTLRPVDVTWAEFEWRRWWVMGAGMPWTWDLRVWIDGQVSNGVTPCTATLNMAQQAGEDLTFQLKYYKFLPFLTADGDTSPIEVARPRLVQLKAKELCFERINDFEAQDQARKMFEAQLVIEARDDATNCVSGQEARM